MKIIQFPEKDRWMEILSRPVADTATLEPSVSNILREVRENGDVAVKKFSTVFDRVSLENIEVSEKEIETAVVEVDKDLKAAIGQAKKNIEKFHNGQVQPIEKIETMPGVQCWRKSVAIEKIGLYIPGGTAPLFSTLLMLGIPAKIAGCKEIILCSPPSPDGRINPVILYVAQLIGIKKIYKAGGVQAIAAMAYGTETISRVDKIFGPGNQYVTCAKQLVQKDGLAIDMPAGPSEVAVFADQSANADFVASDLLSQAEHGVDSQSLLVTNSKELIDKVLSAIDQQIKNLPRAAITQKALENSRAILVKNEKEAIELLNAYAPEHLILSCKNAEKLSADVINAGSVFLGHYSPESAGDYASGTNHTLPTNGYARSYSGVSVDSFVKKITFQQLTKKGLENIGPAVISMAEAEGLDAHANAVKIRISEL
ncbi:MAG: histidinol dehydrogenase [Bacteroidetes bacterium]|nr:histidinol dehydrogenase [Bacteroidota bacterium]